MFGNRTFGGQYWAQSSLLRRIVPPFVVRGLIGGSGFPPERIKKLLDQIALRGVDSLEEDEVVALLMLGYL